MHAGTMGSNNLSEYFVSLSGGPSWANTGSIQIIVLQPDLSNNYNPNNLNNSNIIGNGELFAGMQKSFFPQVQSQFGLAIYVSSFAKLNGFIQQNGDSGFQNYSYKYKIQHSHVALKSKWIAENSYNMNPYISGSIGVGFNRSYGYESTPLIFQVVPNPPFQSRSQVALTYSLGAGFQHIVNQHLSMGLGYQLVSWGANSLDRAEGQTLGKGLSLSTLYTHGVEFNVSYII
jgi:hypothetical protein